MILAEDGKKMSKRLKNYPDPSDVMMKYGADAMRFAIMSSPVVRAEEIRFSEKIVAEALQQVMLPLWNTYSFFVTYANAAEYEPVDSRRHSNHPLDQWIRAEVQDLTNRMTQELDRYDLSATCSELHDTIDALTNWYVRLSRRRFAGKGAQDAPDASGDLEQEDQLNALNTLYDVLLSLSQVLGPFCPFITDAIYLNLVPEDHGSVHLTDWPEVRDLSNDELQLLEKNRLMRLIVSLGMRVRAESTVKTRQPLASAVIALPPKLVANLTFANEDFQLLRQELNVKEISFSENPDELAESIVQVDARKVGPRLGARVQEVIKAAKSGEFTVNNDGTILVLDEKFSPDEAQVVYRGKEDGNIAADKGVVISLDTNLTDALLSEGSARDLIRTVQRLRKESGLAFTDEITLHVRGLDTVLQQHGELIAQETRSTLGESNGESHQVEFEDNKVTIAFEKR
jgi:isoleucyl-tRNA synthetase